MCSISFHKYTVYIHSNDSFVLKLVIMAKFSYRDNLIETNEVNLWTIPACIRAESEMVRKSHNIFRQINFTVLYV